MVDIELGATTVVNGEGASVEGDTVLITAAGVYHVSGTLTDGCIEVDAKGKVYLEFDGVDITSSSGPAVLVTDAKKVVISLVDWDDQLPYGHGRRSRRHRYPADQRHPSHQRQRHPDRLREQQRGHLR